MLSAHKRQAKDMFFQQAVHKVIENNVNKKMTTGQIRRWSYQVGFAKFMKNPDFKEIFKYFKSNIADVLAKESEILKID